MAHRFSIAGLLDWEYSGFYPEYHELIKSSNGLSTGTCSYQSVFHQNSIECGGYRTTLRRPWWSYHHLVLEGNGGISN
ncbi:hypothetical protein I7I53_01134 [Histoplasma capsulatum var. duboisii H88]|uniref:Uncharacterized protein n=1 Tax=Ajellomyces capsulatus (strain H88) TaxID=544711 RepID=A0A8A1LIT4_AJEC8|nr:hypothetical protein I7I53_01134 [Histoplasma capsulatum var. duboisii H88]